MGMVSPPVDPDAEAIPGRPGVAPQRCRWTRLGSCDVTGDVTSQGATQPQALMRKCSKTACSKPAVATLTYVYSDSTAVVGPLATYAEPHTYDLCTDHAERLTPPIGWDMVRLSIDGTQHAPTGTRALCMSDDLSALVDAVREQPGGTAVSPARPRQEPPSPSAGWESGASRGHLRAVRLVNDPTED